MIDLLQFGKRPRPTAVRSRGANTCGTCWGGTYWTQRETLIGLLEWLAPLGDTEGMIGWPEDAISARRLAGHLKNDEA